MDAPVCIEVSQSELQDWHAWAQYTCMVKQISPASCLGTTAKPVIVAVLSQHKMLLCYYNVTCRPLTVAMQRTESVKSIYPYSSNSCQLPNKNKSIIDAQVPISNDYTVCNHEFQIKNAFN